MTAHLLTRRLLDATGAEELVDTEEIQEGDEREEAPDARADEVQDACTAALLCVCEHHLTKIARLRTHAKDAYDQHQEY